MKEILAVIGLVLIFVLCCGLGPPRECRDEVHELQLWASCDPGASSTIVTVGLNKYVHCTCDKAVEATGESIP
jgi:hypothetical protein